MEDAMMAYRIVRAPERRIFYVDVGNIAQQDVEQYIQLIMKQMKRNQIVDADTGRDREGAGSDLQPRAGGPKGMMNWWADKKARPEGRDSYPPRIRKVTTSQRRLPGGVVKKPKA